MRLLIAQSGILLPQPESPQPQVSAFLTPLTNNQQGQNEDVFPYESPAKTNTSSDTFVSAAEDVSSEGYSEVSAEDWPLSEVSVQSHDPAFFSESDASLRCRPETPEPPGEVVKFKSEPSQADSPVMSNAVAVTASRVTKLDGKSIVKPYFLHMISSQEPSWKDEFIGVGLVESRSSEHDVSKIKQHQHVMAEVCPEYAGNQFCRSVHSNINGRLTESYGLQKFIDFNTTSTNKAGSIACISYDPLVPEFSVPRPSPNVRNVQNTIDILPSINEENTELCKSYNIRSNASVAEPRRDEKHITLLRTSLPYYERPTTQRHVGMMSTFGSGVSTSRRRSVSSPCSLDFGFDNRNCQDGKTRPVQRHFPYPFNHKIDRPRSPSTLRVTTTRGYLAVPPPGSLSETLLSQPLFFSYNRHHPLTNCSLPTCQLPTHSRSSTTVVCPRCGPLSFVRYCNAAHLRIDVLRHYTTECTHRQNLLPMVDMTTINPLTQPLHPFITIKPISDSLERHRQALYRCFPHTATAKYHVFDDADLVIADLPQGTLPAPETLAKHRGHGSVIVTINFAGHDVKKTQIVSILERMLALGVMAGKVAPTECTLLYNWIKTDLLRRGLWDEIMVDRVCLAMQLEFGWKVEKSLW